MLDVFPYLRATLQADSYFVTTLSGFKDAQNRFKVYKGDEAPTAENPFITVELAPGGESQRTGWATVVASFHATGTDKDWSLLYQIADKIADIFQATQATASVGGTAVKYQTVGEAVYGEGRNPVTEQVVVSVALTFGIVD